MHTCGELRAENIGEVVTLTIGFGAVVTSVAFVFVDLRDQRRALTQVLFDPDVAPGGIQDA